MLIQCQEGQLYNKWRAYGQGKTANILLAVALAAKLGDKRLTTVSLHPGVIGTNLANHLDWNIDFEGLRKSFLDPSHHERIMLISP